MSSKIRMILSLFLIIMLTSVISGCSLANLTDNSGKGQTPLEIAMQDSSVQKFIQTSDSVKTSYEYYPQSEIEKALDIIKSECNSTDAKAEEMYKVIFTGSVSEGSEEKTEISVWIDWRSKEIECVVEQ